MNIKGFKIKNQKVQKLWIAVFIAITVAIFLIVTSFILVFKSKNNINIDDLFDFRTYYTKYNVVTYSNKNQNMYIMEEYCINENNEQKFRFNTINDNANYSYIVTPDSFHIKSESQINEFENYNNLESNANILSLATFIQIYEKINKMVNENMFSDNGVLLEVEQKDDTISYNIIFKDSKLNKGDILYKYQETLVDGMKISKLELIVDKNSNIPIEYIVYLENGKAYIDINYIEFKINPKIDEKVFSF